MLSRRKDWKLCLTTKAPIHFINIPIQDLNLTNKYYFLVLKCTQTYFKY